MTSNLCPAWSPVPREVCKLDENDRHRAVVDDVAQEAAGQE
jgi:hypothetical protein